MVPNPCDAETPREFEWGDWRDTIIRTRLRLVKDNVGVVAAGVAFYSLLALFPLITFAISIYGYFLDPIDAQAHIHSISRVLPPEAWQIIKTQIETVTQAGGTGLGISIIISILFALWTAGAGIRAMIKAVNLAYGEYEKRNPLKFYGLTFAMTIGAAALIYAALALIVVVTAALEFLPFEWASSMAVRTLPWVTMTLLFFLSVAIFYRIGPSRRMAKLRWIVPGALFATVFWVIISYAFAQYVASFSRFSTVYGSLAAVIILLVWFWLTTYAVIAGATLNAEMELQTVADTTRKYDRPRGKRGAFVADTLPRPLPKRTSWLTLVFVLILGRSPGPN